MYLFCEINVKKMTNERESVFFCQQCIRIDVTKSKINMFGC